MDYSQTEDRTSMVLERMENSLDSLEQMSFDSINVTDKLVTGINEIRTCVMQLKDCPEPEREIVVEVILKLLQDLLVTAFTVNNVSHELEKETAYQRDTVANIKQIVDFLYAMSEGPF
ncbi:MAG: hypothetical protein LUH14_12775 [Clostridiaceae bacterium]|nr:hypothetical protein [Clostridiaceae bacterium]